MSNLEKVMPICKVENLSGGKNSIIPDTPGRKIDKDTFSETKYPAESVNLRQLHGQVTNRQTSGALFTQA